jgi:hypothetical protein
MSTTIRCVACGHQLLVGNDDRPWLTCPRCLTELMNPRASPVSAAPPPPQGPAPVPPAEPVTIPVCPECGLDVRPEWRFCPGCNASLRRRRGGRLPPEPWLERDVRRDTTGTLVSLLTLGALLVAGVIAFLVMDGLSLVDASREGPVVLMVALLVIGAITVGVVVLAFAAKGRTTRMVSSAVGGAAVMITVAASVGLLLMFAVCAGIANFIETCARCGGPPR